MGIYTTFGNLVHDTALDFGPRLAEARFRPASTKATISGHGASTGGIRELRHRPALPQRRRRDDKQDGEPLCSDKDSV